MITQKGLEIIQSVLGIPMKNIFEEKDFGTIVKNKGKTGKLLENVILRLKPNSFVWDFEDGELKSNKWIKNTPTEDVKICMICEQFDDIVTSTNLTETYPMQKISNWLYVGIDKTNEDPHEWFFKNIAHISRDNPKYASWYAELDKGYATLIKKMKYKCDAGEKFSCMTSGPIRVKTAGSGKYPIFSKYYNKFV